MNDVAQDYRTLGLAPGCSLQALKAARRRLVVTWHPDRFPNESGEKARAEERIKDINTAFDRLVEHHRRFGKLPMPAVAAASTPPVASPAAASTESRKADATPAVDRVRRAADSLQYTHMRAPIRWAIAIVLIVLFTQTMHTNVNDPDGPPPTDESQLNESLDDEAANNVPSPPLQSSTQRVFRAGSTIDDVYAAQGNPTATQNGVWYYGKSKVYFTNGIVTGWDIDPAYPLNIALHSDSTSTKPEPSTFTVGSTKAEVRAVQGAPFGETDTRWDYGPSTVYFRDGRVVRWTNSPLHPLKAR